MFIQAGFNSIDVASYDLRDIITVLTQNLTQITLNSRKKWRKNVRAIMFLRMFEIIDVISPIVIILAFSCKRLFQFQSLRGADVVLV